jgi:hypothetical protein
LSIIHKNDGTGISHEYCRNANLGIPHHKIFFNGLFIFAFKGNIPAEKVRPA